MEYLWFVAPLLLVLAALSLTQHPWLSRLKRVPNTHRKFGEADSYLQCTVFYEGHATKLLMTQVEFAKLRDRAVDQPEEFNNVK